MPRDARSNRRRHRWLGKGSGQVAFDTGMRIVHVASMEAFMIGPRRGFGEGRSPPDTRFSPDQLVLDCEIDNMAKHLKG
jgi:hypothetical protein